MLIYVCAPWRVNSLKSQPSGGDTLISLHNWTLWCRYDEIATKLLTSGVNPSAHFKKRGWKHVFLQRLIVYPSSNQPCIHLLEHLTHVLLILFWSESWSRWDVTPRCSCEVGWTASPARHPLHFVPSHKDMHADSLLNTASFVAYRNSTTA